MRVVANQYCMKCHKRTPGYSGMLRIKKVCPECGHKTIPANNLFAMRDRKKHGVA